MDRGNRISQQRVHGTRKRNLYIYFYCKRHSENGQVKRGVFAELGRDPEIKLTRERVRVIYERMKSEMEGNNVETE